MNLNQTGHSKTIFGASLEDLYDTNDNKKRQETSED